MQRLGFLNTAFDRIRWVLNLKASELKHYIHKFGVPLFVAGNSLLIIRTWEHADSYMPPWKSAVAIDDPFNPTGYVVYDWGKFLVGEEKFNEN